jgi:hypothetical protein
VRLHASLFLRAAAIVTATAANVRLIAAGHVWAMALTGFAISWIWVANTRAVVRFDTPLSREAYACGAAAGTLLGWWLAGCL